MQGHGSSDAQVHAPGDVHPGSHVWFTQVAIRRTFNRLSGLSSFRNDRLRLLDCFELVFKNDLLKLKLYLSQLHKRILVELVDQPPRYGILDRARIKFENRWSIRNVCPSLWVLRVRTPKAGEY
jgi:hypothetical protein